MIHPRALLFPVFALVIVQSLASGQSGPRGTTGTQNPGLAERFTAIAMDMRSQGATTSTPSDEVEIVIERWSTQTEHDTLISASRSGGQNAVLLAVENIRTRVGYIRYPLTGRLLPLDMKYARERWTGDGGRRIVLMTNLPVYRRDAGVSPIDYPFTLVELQLTKTGRGEGRMVARGRLTVGEDERFDVENYDAQAVLLKHVAKQ